MSDPVPFMSPRLVGERFNGHAIPLEVLKDLSVLEEMVIEVAKWRFLQEHQDRHRTPRGFTDGISLKVTAIEDGSAVPKIALCFTAATMLMSPYQSYFERARDNIIDAIDAAEHDEVIAGHLPDNLLSYFDPLGRNLREGERIEFRPENHDRPACLDKSTRRKLVLASSKVQELTEEVVLRGAVPEADQAKMTFELQVISGPKVTVNMRDQHLANVLKAFAEYRDGTRVMLKGVGSYNRLEKLQSVVSVDQISVLEPNDVSARLDEFRSLADGWLEGKGKAPSKAGLDWFSAAFETRYPDELPLPYVYPTAEGGVQLEWSIAGHEVSLDISLETKQGQWHSLNMTTQDEATRELQLMRAEDWGWFNAEIKRLAEGAA